MGAFKKFCKNTDCGKEFMGTRTQQYCCPNCRIQTYIPKEKKEKKACSLDEVANKARELGMSYGKYVAMQYKNERKMK